MLKRRCTVRNKARKSNNMVSVEKSGKDEFWASCRQPLPYRIMEGLHVIRQESPRKAPNVERRIMQVATIRWDFPQGHTDERSVQYWDKIPGL